MTTQTTILEGAGIEIVSEAQTINSELETRTDTKRKINRSKDNCKGGNNYNVFELPMPILLEMENENNHFISKLLDLKKSLCPFKNVTPKQSDKFEVGAILTDSWGYDQTNIDFYCIVKRSGLWITVLPMTQHTSAEIGFMTNEETPLEIDFTADPVRKKLYIAKEAHRLGEELGFSFRNYSGGGWCDLWDGKKETSTHYA